MLKALRTLTSTLATASCLAALSTSAGAATLQFLGWEAGYKTVTISSPVSVTANAGEFKILWDNSLSTSAFCIELSQTITVPGTYSDYTKVAMTGPLAELGRLYEAHYASIGSDALKGAAFQVAIWDLLNPTFAASSASSAVALGRQWADDARNGSLPAGNWQFFALTSRSHQDQLIASRVPVPATALLLGAGLLGIAGLRRRS